MTKQKKQYEIAAGWLDIEFGPFISGSKFRSYDNILGWMKNDTSPGYPWTLECPKKQDYWYKYNTSFFNDYWTRLATANPIRTLCSVSIKEELRLNSKINDNKGRTIIAMDVNHVTSAMIMFWEQNQRLVKSCLKHSMALGLNMKQGGAQVLVEHMERYGPNKNSLALDGVQFDGNSFDHQYKLIADFRYNNLAIPYKTSENRVRVNNSYYDIIHSPVVDIDGLVYGKHAGNPSGQGNTTPDNGFKNKMDQSVIWMKTAPEKIRYDYTAFDKYTRACIVGDDIDITVDPVVQKYYNIDTIMEKASEIHMEYTSETSDFAKFTDLTFLGHSFKECEIPGLPFKMWLPNIECCKMRNSMLRYNEMHTPSMTIIRACGLREETFSCLECRNWFQELIQYLRNKFSGDLSPEIANAWKSYLTDGQLYEIYTGFSAIPRKL